MDALFRNEIAVHTIRELIDRAAERQGGSPFLVSPETGRALTFGDLRDSAISLSGELRRIGLEKGDKVAFLLDNGLFTSRLFLGTMYGGFVSVPLNVRAGRSQISYTLEHCDAKVVFVGKEYRSLINEVLGEVARPIHVIDADVDSVSDRRQSEQEAILLPAPDAGDVALLMYTSGSTGQPKGAVHCHRSVLAGAQNSVFAHQLSPADRSLLVLPLYHINAECVTLVPALLSGGSVVVPHRFFVNHFWDWLDEYRCTWSALVPTIVSQLLNWEDPRADSRTDAFRRIRFLRSSSAPLSPSLHRAFLDRFPLLLIQAMGSTEAGNIFSNPLPPCENKIGSPGLPWGFAAKIVNRAGIELPPGESGEVLVRGPAVMQGYYKEPEGTAAVLCPDGWLHTGDLAYRDQDGYFFVVGRSKELVIKGGVNIAPRQIDEVLESHPSVLEAAAVGVPDRYLGEDLVAFVVLRAGIAGDERELLTFCESRLGHFKTPSRIHFVRDLPKGPSGKVQRLRLLNEAARPAVATSTSSGSEVAVMHGDGRRAHLGLSTASSPIEQVIAEAWLEFLEEPKVDVQDNFFALGGNSLLAIQCLSRLREKLPIALSLSDFFENATVAQQAALVRQRLSLGARTNGDAPPDQSDAAKEQAQLQQLAQLSGPDAIPRRDRALPCPLSPAQQRLWFLEQLSPGLPVYNESEAVRLKGEFNADAIESALNAIISRHEILRTTIQAKGEQVIATVHESWPLRFKKIDLRHLPAARQDAEVERLLVEEPRHPFHLEAEPGLRATVIQLAAEVHVFILMVHHIICDRLSLGVLWLEAGTLYEALLRGEPASLPPLPNQYGDYAAWQQQQIQTANFEQDLSFWNENLRGAPKLLELPTDRPRPRVTSYLGVKRQFRLGPDLAKGVRDLSRREQTSLFTVFAATLNMLLYRYSGQDDILVGIPIADRDWPELQPLIGFFVDTHVLRTDLTGNPTFRELLGRIQRAMVGVYSHRALPFDQVVATLKPERNLSYSPLFQVMLNWRDRSSQLQFVGLPRLILEPLLAQSMTSKFDLTIFLTDAVDDIWLEIEYSTELFDDTRIERMIGHLRTLLEGVLADADRPISELPLLTDPERQQVLFDWNQTEVAYPKDRCLHELIEEQGERTPDAVAVVFEDTQLTYRQLNERANQLAHYLRSLGVRPEQLVGVCMERSLEMVVALYGILKAGGAYVPIDPEYPSDRVAFMLEDANVSVLLTQSRLAGKLPPHQAKVVCLDSGWEEIAREGDAKPTNLVSASNLAYMIYTSGSTGRPKGAMNTHRGICNRLLWAQAQYNLTSTDAVLQKTPFSFDVSVWEFFWPLLAGARLVVARPGGHKDAAYLARVIEEQQITVIHFVPPMLRVFLEDADAGQCGSLRHVMCSGEALEFDLQELFFQRVRAQLHNLYGPTEAAVEVTHWTCQRNSSLGVVPIGRPVANTQTYILDRCLQPVPIGVPGELHLGGVQIGRGYHNRPELTAEKFIPDPFSAEAEARLYKTGDLARYLPDGAIEYLGRLDHQVKIRGFRIELGEIESVLAGHPGVREAVAVAREDVPGEKRLVAYLTRKAEELPSVPELRDLLQAKLPDYMVPSAFVFLKALPLTPNGKVDRKSLPAPDLARPELETTLVAPRTSIEKVLADIWSQVLRIEQVGVHDRFFELGGDSILSIQVIAKSNQAGLRLTPKQIFQHQTIAELALVAEAVTHPRSEQGLVTGDVPLTPIQKWFFEQDYADHHHWNQVRLLELRQDLDPGLLERAIQELVLHHDALRLRFVREDQGWRQFNAGSEEAVKLALVDLAGTPEPEQTALMESTAAGLQASLNLSQGPLARAALFDLGAGRPRRLLFVIHHHAVDGVSWRILLEDLQAICQQIQSGGTVKLPAKTTSFRQWAQKVADHAHSAALGQEANYWLAVSSTESGSLAVDFSSDENTEASARTVSVAFDAEQTRALLQQVPQAYNTQINDVLLSALGLALTHWLEQPTVWINLEGHGREELFDGVDLSRTVGWFTTIFPVKLDLNGIGGPGEVLKSVKEQLRRIPHRGIGYGMLRYLCGDETVAAQLRALWQPEVIFNYLGQFDRTVPTSPFVLVEGPIGPARSPLARRSHLLEINSLVADGRLRLDWRYSEGVHRRSTIERLAQNFLEAVRSLIHHCTSPSAGGYTPSDFVNVGLDQENLDKLIAKLS